VKKKNTGIPRTCCDIFSKTHKFVKTNAQVSIMTQYFCCKLDAFYTT